MNLLPCPFCGGVDIEFLTFDYQESKNRAMSDRESGGMVCGDCGAVGGTMNIQIDYKDGVIITDYKAIEEISRGRWNRRSYSHTEGLIEIQKYDKELKDYIK